MKCFNLLWRGSRDGFTAREFHRRCDGHPNTLTLILDTDSNVFGGFTPVEWESRVWNRMRGEMNNCKKADDSRRSFLFTLSNPYGVPPRKFTLRGKGRFYAIDCHSDFGPVCADCLGVSNDCNANRDNITRIGTLYANRTYTNDTTFENLFTGQENFRVKEIEVFEITD
jgi:hypothetical protein